MTFLWQHHREVHWQPTTVGASQDVDGEMALWKISSS